MPTRVHKCSCEHKQQDEIHGSQNRVHNVSADGKNMVCTVCKSSKPTGE